MAWQGMVQRLALELIVCKISTAISCTAGGDEHASWDGQDPVAATSRTVLQCRKALPSHTGVSSVVPEESPQGRLTHVTRVLSKFCF